MNRNIRRLLSVFWIAAGAALLVLSLAGVLEGSVYGGMGGALLAVGVLQTLRHVKYDRDPEYREKIDTVEGDERIRYIGMRSWTCAGYIAVLAECVGIIAALIFDQPVIRQVLSGSVCLILCAYWISYLVISKKS